MAICGLNYTPMKNKTPNTKRPKKGEITAVMLEFYNENNHHWEFYTILFDTTPQKAVQSYYKNALGRSILKRDIVMQGQGHAIAEEAQAYYITF